MKRIILLTIALLAVFATMGMAGNAGLVNVKSTHNVAVTADRLEGILAEKGMQLFLRLNHAEGAGNVGIQLRPTELLIFGNPKVGAPLMAKHQQIGIDLPQKMLIWQDESGQVWLTYNDPDYLADRHDLDKNLPSFAKVRKALGAFAQSAGAP
jgi:uncharacterized protein (DUF302 family)